MVGPPQSASLNLLTESCFLISISFRAFSFNKCCETEISSRCYFLVCVGSGLKQLVCCGKRANACGGRLIFGCITTLLPLLGSEMMLISF